MGTLVPLVPSIEKKLEKKARLEIQKMGGELLKFRPFQDGYPDRIALMPKGQVWFVEFKDRGKKPNKLQQYQIIKLTMMGYRVWVVESEDVLKKFLNEVRTVSIPGSLH